MYLENVLFLLHIQVQADQKGEVSLSANPALFFILLVRANHTGLNKVQVVQILRPSSEPNPYLFDASASLLPPAEQK